MTDKPRIDKAQIDQLYAACLLTEEAYQTALARWTAQQISAGASPSGSSQRNTSDNRRNRVFESCML